MVFVHQFQLIAKTVVVVELFVVLMKFALEVNVKYCQQDQQDQQEQQDHKDFKEKQVLMEQRARQARKE